MDTLIRLFDAFNSAAYALVKYIPQNKEDVLVLWQRVWGLALDLNNWVSGTLGIDIQSLINKFAAFFIKYFSIAFNFLIELAKKLVERV